MFLVHSHLLLMTLLGGQVLPLWHGLSDVDHCLDCFVQGRLDAVEVRLHHDLRDDKDYFSDEQRRRSVRPTGNSRSSVT